MLPIQILRLLHFCQCSMFMFYNALMIMNTHHNDDDEYDKDSMNYGNDDGDDDCDDDCDDDGDDDDLHLRSSSFGFTLRNAELRSAAFATIIVTVTMMICNYCDDCDDDDDDGADAKAPTQV